MLYIWHIIEKSFKRMGLCSDVNGKENYLVKIRKLRTYCPPSIDAAPMEALKLKEIKEFKKRETEIHQQERLNKRKQTLERRRETIKRRKRD